MDICRISQKEEFLAAFGTITRAEQETLLAAIATDPPAPSAAAAALAILLPAVSIAALPRGPFLWVAATLLFSMVYPALLLAAALRRRRQPSDRAYVRTLRSLGILEPGRKLGYLAANAFVINARAAALPFAWYAAVNLFVALTWVRDGGVARGLGVVIAVQSAIVLISGFVAWRLTPGVGSLRRRTAAVRDRLAGYRSLAWVAVALLSVPVGFAAAVLVSILVVPGTPLIRVLAVGRVSPFAQSLEFALLLVGLYAVTRMAHSAASRPLARQVAEAVVRYIDGELMPRVRGGAAATDCEEYRALATGLLEARVYRFSRSTLAGRLPVYSLGTDLALVADPETLGALRGHLDLEPNPG
jgi:hypothetical protein